MTPMPAPFVRFDSASFDDESTFASAKTVTLNHVTNQIVINSVPYAKSLASPIATTLSLIFEIDVSEEGFYEAGYQVVGGPLVAPVVTAGVLTGVKLGSATLTVGEASSLVALLEAWGF